MKTSAMSQCVADYADRIKDVEALLTNHPNELKFYQKFNAWISERLGT